MLFLLVTSVLALAFETRTARADGPVYINADGSITPSTAPISTFDNITYTLTGNANESIIVQRSSIVVDGAGHTVEGSGSGNGIDLESVSNVTVENVSVNDFSSGIWLNSSFNDTLADNSLNWNGPYGIYLNISSTDTLYDNYASGSRVAIYLYNSSNNTLAGNTAIENDQGIILDSSSNNTLNDNDVTENPGVGIALYSSSNNTLIGNTVLGNAGLGGAGIYLSSSAYNRLSSNNATENYYGIVFDFSSDNILIQNVIDRSFDSNFVLYGSTLSDYVNWVDASNLADGKPVYYIVNQDGLLINPATHPAIGYLALVNCANITIENLTLANKNKESLLLAYTINSTITQNNVVNNDYGIHLYSSSDNALLENNVTAATKYTDTAIVLDYSYNNTVSHNNVTGNGGGIHLDSSSGNTVSGNNLTENQGGIGLVGSSNNTLSNNIVDASTSWGIWLLDSFSNMVLGNTVTQNDFQGIYLSSSFDDTASGNNVTENYGVGIYVGYYCFNETVSGNDVSENSADAISIDYCSNVTVSGNNATGNDADGIALYSSSGNTVFANNAVENGRGILLDNSSSNTIYHNNFLDNTQQAALSSSEPNAWNDVYPSGGNYWGYAGVDEKSGPSQYQNGSDGISDTPYVIDANNTDHYPLMAPITSFDAGTWNGTASNVDIISNSTVSNLQIDIQDKTVSFNVTGLESTSGFCRVTMPNTIVQDLWHGNYTVLLNNERLPFQNWTDTSNTYIYINYTHSEHEVTIITEFPSIMPLLLLTAFLALVVALAKRRTLRNSKLDLAQRLPFTSQE
jgi:parallel beta-helix repeat protein